MIDEGYDLDGPDEDGYYTCEECGHRFEIPKGEPLECPICKQIAEGPKLKPCPFCGHSAVYLEWGLKDRWNDGNHHQIRACCLMCPVQTDLYETAAEAAARWNRRYEDPWRTGLHRGLKACPFCGGDAYIERTTDEEDPDYHRYIVICGRCGSRTDFTDDEADIDTMADAWNKRRKPIDYDPRDAPKIPGLGYGPNVRKPFNVR